MSLTRSQIRVYSLSEISVKLKPPFSYSSKPGAKMERKFSLVMMILRLQSYDLLGNNVLGKVYKHESSQRHSR